MCVIIFVNLCNDERVDQICREGRQLLHNGRASPHTLQMLRVLTICTGWEVMKTGHSFSGFADVEKGKALSKLFEFGSNFKLWFKGGGERISSLIKTNWNQQSLAR